MIQPDQPGRWRLRRTVALAVRGLLAAALLVPCAASASAAALPQMHFDRHLRVQTVCFSGPGPSAARVTLYGQRFDDRPVNPLAPAIVLVHGAASSTATWDLSPRWSVARALASQGYVVFSYDRLGFARSSYLHIPGGGDAVTAAVQRRLLHAIVGEIRAGTYRIGRAGGCVAPSRASGPASRRVVIAGHSSGGWVVAGYPGEYHDVGAMIQADISASAAGAVAPGGALTPTPGHPDYYTFFQSRADCERFNAYPPGALGYVLTVACAPPFRITPFGEISGLGQALADNARYIPRIGPNIPVLLTSGDHDTTEPVAAAQSDLAYYRAHCNCQVSQFFVRDSGHLFMAHRSLPTWIAHIVRWLTAHRLGPSTAGTSPK